jgi:hypothetical protein
MGGAFVPVGAEQERAREERGREREKDPIQIKFSQNFKQKHEKL